MNMLVTFTDFGQEGPYLGQLKLVLHREAAGTPVVDLLIDAPAQQIQASAYLLAAYTRDFPTTSVFVVIVDPGVGSNLREPVVLEADGRLFVGPGNGVFELVRRRAKATRQWHIDWQPPHMSTSFHGRDLFAPVAAWLASGKVSPGAPSLFSSMEPETHGREWPDDWPAVCYIDRYGNLITGVRAAQAEGKSLAVNGRAIPRVRTFADVPVGEVLCYENSSGLLEIAVNQGSACATLGLLVNSEVEVIPAPKV